MLERTQPELEIVRKFSWLHTELVPYMYSHVVACHNDGPPLMRPLRVRKVLRPESGGLAFGSFGEDTRWIPELLRRCWLRPAK